MRVFTYILFLLLTIGSIQAQNNVPVEVRISSNKVSIGGQGFYIHIVEKGQTLYSISKAYGITKNLIVMHNPGAQVSLSVDQALKIPVQNQDILLPRSKEVKEKKEVVDTSKVGMKNWIHYKVKPKETLYAIARRYHVEVDTLETLNPSVIKGLKVDQILKIPKPGPEAPSFSYTIDTTEIYHRVRRKETMFSIAKKYDISIGDIVKFNRGVVFSGLKQGKILVIPNYDTVIQFPTISYVDTFSIDTVNNVYFKFHTGTYSELEGMLDSTLVDSTKDDTLRITYLLPFRYQYLQKLESLIDTCKDQARVRFAKKRYGYYSKKADEWVDFYLGSLLSIESFKKSSMPLKVRVYDTKADKEHVRYLINKHALKNEHFVFGPMESAGIETALTHLGNTDVSLILPKVKSLDAYHNVYQILPGSEALDEAASHYISTQHDKNIIFIYEQDSVSSLDKETFKNRVLNYLSFYNKMDTTVVKEIMVDDSIKNNLKDALTEGKPNLLVLLTNNEAVAANITRNYLNYLKSDFDITILTGPRWLQFKNIDLHLLHQLNHVVFTPFYTSLQDKSVQKVFKKVHKKFSTEPYRENAHVSFKYHLLGYDLTNIFVGSYINDAASWRKEIQYSSGTETEYKFIKISEQGGYENVGVRFMNFKGDFEVEKITQ